MFEPSFCLFAKLVLYPVTVTKILTNDNLTCNTVFSVKTVLRGRILYFSNLTVTRQN